MVWAWLEHASSRSSIVIVVVFHWVGSTRNTQETRMCFSSKYTVFLLFFPCIQTVCMYFYIFLSWQTSQCVFINNDVYICHDTYSMYLIITMIIIIIITGTEFADNPEWCKMFFLMMVVSRGKNKHVRGSKLENVYIEFQIEKHN